MSDWAEKRVDKLWLTLRFDADWDKPRLVIALREAEERGWRAGHEAGVKAFEMWKGINCLNSSETQQQAENMLDQFFDGLRVDATNRKAAKQYLVEHLGAAFGRGRDSILARLKEPDEALIEAVTRAWMNRNLSDPDSDPIHDAIRAIVSYFSTQTQENSDAQTKP